MGVGRVRGSSWLVGGFWGIVGGVGGALVWRYAVQGAKMRERCAVAVRYGVRRDILRAMACKGARRCVYMARAVERVGARFIAVVERVI